MASLSFRKTCAVAVSLLALGGQAWADHPPGLTVVDGQFYQDGKPFRGIGINYFSCLIRITGTAPKGPDFENRDYKDGFRVLKAHGIPFVRFCAGGFWPNDWQLYLSDKERYFEIFDELVAEAERQGLGLIPSLFWTYSTLPDLVGESLDQWGNADSKTRAFMRQYTTEVVSRYKDSPAIWAWELGNEWIHEADIPQEELGRGWIVPAYGTPATRSSKDKLFRPTIYSAQQDFYQTVRSLDPTRAVFTGDALPRPAAWHNRHNASWSIDSPDQWQEIFLADNPFDTLSVHLYYYRPEDRPRDGGVLHFSPAEQIDFLMQISQLSGKPLFIGEFGQEPSDAVSLEEQSAQVAEILDWITHSQVPLSALWNYDLDSPHHRHFHITGTNERAGFLEMLRKANEALALSSSASAISHPEPDSKARKPQPPLLPIAHTQKP